ncbi:MAG: DJ-1/PfpI family protein, partial [Rhodococcus sp. (in: high G+C Gram-positive bacteria)]
MSQQLTGKKVAFLVATEGVEQIELTDPWDALVAEHAQPSIVSTESGTIQAFNHLDKADVFDVDAVVESAESSEYDALVLPGGVANPDFLRM